MIENRDWIFDGIGAALIILLITSGFQVLSRFFRIKQDGRKIYDWLLSNTKDEPHASHKSLLEISVGTRLSQERVSEACLKNEKIYISTQMPECYSVWRAEPQSIYDKRGFLSIG